MHLTFARHINRSFFIFLVSWRLLSVFVVRTYHVPDEYWQSLEVAHRLAFGYGYITWEWQSKIRSYIYPFFIAGIYKILQFIDLDYPSIVIFLPRILQALLSAFADFRFLRWTRCEYAVVFHVFNWYWNYCATRTLTNTLETSLSLIAISVFPWRMKRHEGYLYLWIIGLTCAIRPTTAIIWIPLCIHHIYTNEKSHFKLIFNYIFIILCTLGYSIAIDSFCYGEFIVTPWEFFKANVLTNVADHYGREPFYWYFISALPALLGPFLFILPLGIYQVIKDRRRNHPRFVCLITAAWTIAVYSLLPHKEFRFILPIIPLIIYSATGIFYPSSFHVKDIGATFITRCVLIFNLILGIYCCVVHQRAPLDVMKFLRNEVAKSPSDTDIMFLMPCHSTPFYSHLHVNVPMRFLTCEPNFKDEKNYLDEADQFFRDPKMWIDNNYTDVRMLPKILVMYDNLAPKIKGFLNGHYKSVIKLYDTHFPLPNRGENILVYKLRTAL